MVQGGFPEVRNTEQGCNREGWDSREKGRLAEIVV